MRTFAQKPKVTQLAASAKSTIPGRAAAKSEITSDTAGLDWNFGRIPLHAPAGRQPKLTLGTPQDIDEQEADRVAEQVMRIPAPSMPPEVPATLSGYATTSTERVQMKPTRAGNSGGITAPPVVHGVLRSPGQPLDGATRAFMEPRFGYDFSSVRVHTDANAAESARSVHALAYTVGRHVAFRKDSYRPGTPEGRHLLAHELAHVVQQQSQAAGSTGLQRQVDKASLTDEDTDDPWAKALLEAKRSVFGSSTGKLFQPDAASSLNKPGHDPFFPHHFVPVASQAIGNKNDPPSYAKKPSEGQHAAQSDWTGSIGLTPDQLTSHGKMIGPFRIGVDKRTDIGEQQRKELEKVKEKFTTSKLVEPKFKPQKTGSGAELNILGNYGGGDAGAEKSAGLDLSKISVALEAKIPFSLLKTWFAKKTKPIEASDSGKKKGYTTENIKTAAWNIIQHETSVKNAFLFYSKIMHNFPKSEWDAELEKFFKGEYSARVKLRRNLGTSGATPVRQGGRKHKVTKINARSDFALAVATYLHEMVHYADIVYSSRAPKKKHRRNPAEGTSGIGLPAGSGQAGAKHLSKSEQISARTESIDATIEQILKDMQSPAPRPNEHPRLARREREQFFKAKQASGFDLVKYLADRRAELHGQADAIYEDWADPTENLLELGFAFDKEAYGFYYDPKQKESWAEQFMGKFEVLFDEYLQR
jgi:hypothetical protein